MKKILSLVLVLSLVLGTFSFAFAATPEDVVDTDYEEAVETLMALGVVNGYPDGTYKPDRTLTRAEMAKLLVEALGYGKLAGDTTTSFADAQGHWAENYIGFASAMDIVKGYPDGTFRPNQTMTMDEAVTMIVRSLGYTDDVLKGSWPTNYKVKALDVGVTDDVVVSGAASRGDTAIMLFNALEARLVEVNRDTNGLYTYEFSEDNEGEYKILLDQIGKKDEMEVLPEDVWGDDALDVADSVDLEDYLFNTITYYETDDYDVAYVSDWEYDYVMGTLVENDNDMLTVEDADGDEYDLDYEDLSNNYLAYNGDEADDTEIEDLMVDYTELTVVYNDDDEVLGVVAWEAEVDQITSEYNDRRELKLNGVTGWDLPEDDDELDEDALTVEGDADSLEDIEEDDVVYYYASDDTTRVRLYVVRDTFEGRFTQRASDGEEGTFGGEKFDVSFATRLNLRDEELGDTYVLYLDKDGDIFALELEDTADGTESYAVYIESADGDIDEDRFGEISIDEAPVVKLLTDGGDIVIYDLAADDDDYEDLDEGTYDLGAIDLEIDDLDIFVDTDLEEGDLVEVEMNDDGEITDIVKVGMSYDDNDYDEDDMTVDGYDVTDDTVIFDISDDDSDDWDTIRANQLTEDVEGYMEVDNLEVLAMTVTDGLGTTDDVLAVLMEVNEYYDGRDVIEELTVWIEGEEEVVYTDDDYDTEELLEDAEPVDGVVVGLEFSGDEVVDVNEVNPDEIIKVRDVDSRRVSSDDEVYRYADNFAVYVIEDDEFMVGDDNDVLENDVVMLYLDSDDEVQVLVLDLDDQDYDEFDRDDLNDAEDAVDDLDEDDYTADSWADFEDALEDAMDMPEDDQDDIDDKADAIWDAIDLLEEVDEPDTLEGTIEEALAGDTILVDVDDADDVEAVTVDGEELELGAPNWEYSFDGNTVRIPVNWDLETAEVVITMDGVDYLVEVQ